MESRSLVDGDSIDFDVRLTLSDPLLVDAIESYIRWNAKDKDKKNLQSVLLKKWRFQNHDHCLQSS